MWIYYAVAAAVTWGLEYALLDRILSDKISPVFLRALQMFVGMVAFGGMALCSGRVVADARTVIGDSGLLIPVCASLLTFSLANILIACSIKEGNATVAGLVEMSYPVFIVAFSFLLFGTMHLTMNIVAGGALILIGAALLKF